MLRISSICSLLINPIHLVQLCPAGVWCTHENKLPNAPPNSTISYLESMGRAKDAL